MTRPYEKNKKKFEILKKYYRVESKNFIIEKFKQIGVSGSPSSLWREAQVLAYRHKIKRLSKPDRIIAKGVLKLTTPWNVRVVKPIYLEKGRNSSRIWCTLKANSGADIYGNNTRDIIIGFILTNIHEDSLETKINAVYRKYIRGLQDSEFYCLRCNMIYNRSFARQRGPSGANKCKNCYNLGRVEEKQNNKQSQIRSKLHSYFWQFLKRAWKINKINKSDLIREAVGIGLSTNQQIIQYIKDKYNIDISRRYLHKMKYIAIKRRSLTYSHTQNLVGCSSLELRQFIESQFEEGWTWENWGKVWEIDHIQPYSHFDLTDHEQVKKVMHYTNVRPLSIQDNRTKSDKMEKKEQ